MRCFRGFRAFGLFFLFAFPCLADDWPQWMGPHRDDVWRESGVVQSLPTNGPTVLWRAPIEGGYSGPAVVGDQLFVMDRPGPAAGLTNSAEDHSNSSKNERVLCLDARTGKQIWQHAYA